MTYSTHVACTPQLPSHQTRMQQAARQTNGELRWCRACRIRAAGQAGRGGGGSGDDEEWEEAGGAELAEEEEGSAEGRQRQALQRMAGLLARDWGQHVTLQEVRRPLPMDCDAASKAQKAVRSARACFTLPGACRCHGQVASAFTFAASSVTHLSTRGALILASDFLASVSLFQLVSSHFPARPPGGLAAPAARERPGPPAQAQQPAPQQQQRAAGARPAWLLVPLAADHLPVYAQVRCASLASCSGPPAPRPSPLLRS